MISSRTEFARSVSEAQMRQWLKNHRQGDEKAKNNILRANLGLVIHLAKRFYRPGISIDFGDLIQQGCLGLLRAMDRFDLHKQVQGKPIAFSTYAKYWIEHYVRREIEDHSRTIAVPAHIQTYLRCAARAGNAGGSSNQSTALKRTAEALGISRRRLQSLQFAALQPVPIENLCDGELPAPSIVPASLASVENQFHVPHEKLRQLLDILPARERVLIEQRHGLIPGQSPKILVEVAKLMGLSRERVRQLEVRAIKRMRAASSLTVERSQLSSIHGLLVNSRVP
jgi:RNA polymerase sigma factor (sigma-70 family)